MAIRDYMGPEGRRRALGALSGSGVGRAVRGAYGAIRAHPGPAGAGFAIAAGIGLVREGQGPIESSVVLGPALAGLSVALSMGGASALRNRAMQAQGALGFLLKAPSDWRGPGAAAFQQEFNAAMANNPFMRHMTGVMPGGNADFLSRTNLSRNYAAEMKGLLDPLIAGSQETPMWMRYAGVAAEMQGAPQIMTLGELEEAGMLAQMTGGFANPAELLSRIEGSPDFAREFATRAKGFQSLGKIGTMPSSGKATQAGYTLFERKKIMNQLTQMGRSDLARELAMIPEDVRITGVTSDIAKRSLSGLEFEFGNRRFVTPVVGPNGLVKAGINNKNLYVARRQLYVGSLQGMLSGGKAEVLELDTAVARSIHEFYGAAASRGLTTEFAEYLGGMSNIPLPGLRALDMPGTYRVSGTGSALLWQQNPLRRPSRMGRPTSAMLGLRRLEAEVSAPGLAGLADIFGLGGHLDIWQGQGRLGKDLVTGLAGQGYVGAGSESSVRGGTFVHFGDLSKLTLGAYTTPLDKAHRLIRDVGKGYWMTGQGAAGWRPFQTAAMDRMMGSNVGMATHYQAVFESEIDFLSRRLFKGIRAGGASRRMAMNRSNQFITSVMGPMSTQELRRHRSALSRLAGIREGIFAAATPADARMVHEVEKIVYTLPDEIRQLPIGGALPSNAPIGFDDLNNPVYHNFSRLGGGTTKLTARQAVTINGRTGYILRWEESVAAAQAKFGSDVGKMFAVALKEGDQDVIINFVNNLRKNPKFSRLYGNQSYVPMLSSVARDTVAAFTLAETFKKFQNAPDVLLANLAAHWMPQMSAAGRGSVLGLLKPLGITMKGSSLRFGGRGLNNPTALAGRIQKIDQTLRGLYGDIVSNPTNYGLASDMFAHYGTKSVVGDVLARATLRGGIISESIPWDALNLNVPERVPITHHHLSFLKEYGLGATARELLGRRGIYGDAAATEEFMIGFKDWATSRGTRVASNLPVVNLSQWDVGAKSSIWRGNPLYKRSFVIDLNVANSMVSEGSLRAHLGATKIIVPGTETDFWKNPYRLATGEMAASEQFTEPLQRLLRDVGMAHETGDAGALGRARASLGLYMDRLNEMSGNLMLGRAGTVYDAKASVAGRMAFRNYTRMFQGHATLGGRASKFIVGVHPSTYRKLTGSSRLDPNNIRKGLFSRFPLTTVDPVMIIPDASVARGVIATDETTRALKEMDFDGDTGYLNMIMDEGSAKEIEDLIQGRGAAAGKYAAALETRTALGGVFEDLAKMGRSTAAGGAAFTDIGSAVSERFGAFRYLEQALQGEILSKGYTAHIGRYSNLSKQLIFASQPFGENVQARMIRLHLANQIQQASIDFARKTAKSIDPGALANQMSEAIRAASNGNIDMANDIFRGVMMSLGIGEIDPSIAALQATYKGNAGKLAALEDIRTSTQGILNQWFEPLRNNPTMQADFAQRAQVAQKTAQRELYTAETSASRKWVGEKFNQLAAILEAREEGIGMGIPSLGRGTAGASATTLTAANRMKAAAAGTTHILGDLWKMFRGSRYFKPIAGGAAITGGLMAAMGAMTSPVDAGVPEYTGRQRALMQSPDMGMAGMGGAPLPGAGYGNVAREGEWSRPRRSSRPAPPTNTIPRRYYVNQTNRVPRLRFQGSGDPYDVNAYNEEVSSTLQRLGGGNARVNIVHDATNRRMTELEIEDQVRSDLRGGR